jgi:ATP-dependent DNA helicase RecG
MEQSQDGFYLAEMDLRLRGPGQILGTQQSGLPELAIADLTKDEDLLEIAYQAAQWVLKKDPTLTCWSALQQELSRRHKFFDLEPTVVLN